MTNKSSSTELEIQVDNSELHNNYRLIALTVQSAEI